MRPIHVISIFSLVLLLSLASCNETACENNMCENGGICLDGTCDCPDGFTGTHCQDIASPDKVRIRTITLTRFPVLKSDVGWDPSDGPDMFFRLYDGQYAIAQPLELIENAVGMQEYNFFIPLIEIADVTRHYSLKLLDYDGRDTKEDLMGEIDFVPYDPAKGKPETVILDDGGPVAFQLSLEYLYKKALN
jgi:hypothetical protein